jgi:hypothetical protein
MTATLLNDLRDAVRDDIAARLPELTSCKTIEGKFTLEELKKTSVAAPAVYVSCYGAKPGQTLAGHAPTFVAEMAAYIVARDVLGLKRDVMAANIGAALLQLVFDNTWGLTFVDAPQKIHLHSLVTAKARDVKASLWAVSWDQSFTFFEPASGPLGAKLYVAHAPDGIAPSEGDFELIGGDNG